VTQDQYCRDVESHLCRKNDGHLIRIVGPAFELVCGWAAHGIPLKIVLHGVDRYFERYYAKGPRRRPVRIDFCEADVLDAFDEWRRAVGVGVQRSFERASQDDPAPAKPRQSLASHVDRVVGRLVARETDPTTPELNAEIVRAIERLDRLRDAAATARGAARAQLVEDLAALDRGLMAAARAGCPGDLHESLAREAADDLGPFRERMTTDVYRQAVDSATERLVRDRLGLPRVRYE